MRMLCYKCNHSWKFKGILIEGKLYVTCPNCMRKIRIDKSFVEGSSEQRLLTSLPKKRVKTTSFPLKLLTTSFKREFETIKDKDGFVYRIDKRMSEQFKEVLCNGGIEEVEEVQEEILEDEWKEMPIEVSSPLAKNGKRNVMKKYKECGVPATIKVLNPFLPIQIQKALDEKEQEQNNPFLNPPEEESNFTIRIVPRDPIKILEHQLAYRKNFNL